MPGVRCWPVSRITRSKVLFPPSIALYGLYVVALALCSFHLGGLIAIASAKVRPAGASTPLAIPSATLRYVGLWLVLIAIVPMSILMKQAVTGVMRDGYGVALYTNEAATSFAATPSVLAAFLVPGAFLLLAGSAKRAGLRFTTTAIVAVYSGSLLFIGWRAAAISVAISYIWLWHRCVRAIPRAAILSFGALLLAIMPAIAAMRNLTGQDRVSLDTFVQSVEDAKAFSAIEEMGGIWETVAHTITLVPAERPYDYGASYGLSALTVLPNLFWDVHPALPYGSPETWLVRRVAPWTAARGGGLGFSFIAEAYLNFGLAGCVIIIGTLGFLLARSVRWAEGVGHPLAFALVASALAGSVKYVRADSTELVRPLVWYAIGPYLLVLLLSRRRQANQLTGMASAERPARPSGRKSRRCSAACTNGRPSLFRTLPQLFRPSLTRCECGVAHMKIAIVGGIFGREPALRRHVWYTPETILLEGLRRLGHETAAFSHYQPFRMADFDIVHVHHLSFGAVRAACGASRTPFIFTAHSTNRKDTLDPRESAALCFPPRRCGGRPFRRRTELRLGSIQSARCDPPHDFQRDRLPSLQFCAEVA